MSKAYTAIQAARLGGVSTATIYRYLRDGKIKPKGIPLGDSLNRMIWQFSDTDVARVKQLAAENKPGRKAKAKK